MNLLYQYHDLGLLSLSMVRAFANFAQSCFENGDAPFLGTHSHKAFAAGFEIFGTSLKHFEKPQFEITSVQIGDEILEVEEKDLLMRPFCNIKHFSKKQKDSSLPQEKILIVAPLSGHFASLLKDTVSTLLPHFDVFITDWKDASTVPQSEEDFSLEDYTQYLLDSLSCLGKDVHVLAVCQPVVSVLIMTALTHQLGLECKPKSIILMGGPVDARINPTKINTLLQNFSRDSFERFIISTVPLQYPGHGRRVCPGFMMLLTFLSMNPDKHLNSHMTFIQDSFTGNRKSTLSHQKFYNEYFAVMDLPETYFLDCIRHVFHEHSLPRGVYEWRGIKIDLASITETALMTIEGEHDDISGLGQTKAAHDLCTYIPKDRARHYQALGVGHYGLFSGHRWRETIAPQIIDFITGVKT